MRPISGLKKNRSKPGIANTLANAMIGETFTKTYELAIVRIRELINILTIIARENIRSGSALVFAGTGNRVDG
ncbi:MAG: hypothetical protein QM730_23020 [Anaerolineales bacterium]